MIIGVAIAPDLFYDPINLPKAFVLTIFGVVISLLFIFQSERFPLKELSSNKVTLSIVATFSVGLFVPLVSVSDLSLVRQMSGEFGRLNGIASSLALLLVMVFSIVVSSKSNQVQVFLYWFKLAGYISMTYSMMQLLELDPLNWSGKGTFGFLGNLNFNSAFLGLFSIYCLWRFSLDLELSKRVWWIFLVITNVFVIIQSGSLQGLIVFSLGLISLLRLFLPSIKRSLSSKVKLLLGLQTVSVAGIFLGLLGTFGFGPFSFLTQQTMLFRLDYWLAGLRMAMSKPFTGIGMDGYGRYYREFRDETAAFRTTPERITNASHNVFIDHFAWGGFLLGVGFTLIFAYSLMKAHSTVKSFVGESPRSNADFSESLLIRSLLIGYVFQLLVSINQIGLAIWGWAIAGIALGNWNRLRTKMNRDTSTSRIDEEVSKKLLEGFTRVAILILSIISLATMANYVKVDLNFRSAYSEKNYSKMWTVTQSGQVSSFLSEVALKFAGDAGDYGFLARESNNLLIDDERNYFAWLAQVALPESTTQRRLEAVRELSRLDPYNPEARSLLRAIEEQSLTD